jgi:hypothetical protein
LVFAQAGGCGSNGDGSDPGLADAAADVRPPKPTVRDASKPPPPDSPYVPQTAKCVRDGGVPEAFTAPDASFDAAHPPSPQVLSAGGPVLALPVFVPVTFDGGEHRGEEEDFLGSVGCTDYWHQVTRDYGIGDGVLGPAVHLSEAAPSDISDDQIQAWLIAKILKDPSFPKPDENTLYVLFYPSSTSISLQGDLSCASFGAYHNSIDVQGRGVAYAVIPDCGSFGAIAGIDAITSTTSHELVEAVTDPLPYPQPAYNLPEPDGLGFALAAGGELGDMCEFKSDAFFQPAGYPFFVQRSWSNSRAFALEDPCVPSLPGPFFGVAPRVSDTISFDIGLGPQTARGVIVKVGQQVTIELPAFANGPVAPWGLTAFDAAKFRGGKPDLSLQLSHSTVKDGDVAKLTILRKADSPYGVSAFGLVSTGAGRQTYWWGLVGQ